MTTPYSTLYRLSVSALKEDREANRQMEEGREDQCPSVEQTVNWSEDSLVLSW